MADDTGDRRGPALFDTLRGSVITSIPALTSLVFVIVAVKVFRVSGMEATTTVAIVSTADVVALLKGVTLTLLPGFLTAVAATGLWWWAGRVPATLPGTSTRAARRALLSTEAGFAWAMVVVAFFTVSWPLFLLLLAPAAYATVVLARTARGRGAAADVAPRLRFALRGVGGGAAAVALGFLALAPTVWLPLRTITVTPGHTVTANGTALPSPFAAYVLDRSADGASLLLAEPRAVVTVGPGDIAPVAPLCVTPEAPTRAFYLRPSQVLGLDEDLHSPYPLCPRLPYQTIFGTQGSPSPSDAPGSR